MPTVWKFQILEPVQTFMMPKGAVILHAHTQTPSDILAIWALVDPTQPREPRTFLAS